jgi:hypothetical protein
MRLASRLATAADIEAFYGHPWPTTLRAVVLVLEEKPVAVIGLSREGAAQKLFSDTKPEIEPYLAAKSMTVLRALKRVMGWVEASRLPVLAVADNPPLLERLGFERLEGDLYQCRR